MTAFLSRLLDKLSNFFAARKGLLPILGIILILGNFLGKFIFSGWVAQTDFFLHLGIIIAILGLLIAKAL